MSISKQGFCLENDTPVTKNDRYDFCVPGFAYVLKRKRRVPVLNLYYQRMKIQPAAGDGRSSTKVVLADNNNPSWPPATVVPVL